MEGDIVQMGAYIGAGLACTGMGGAAVGVGHVVGNFIAGALRNPSAAAVQTATMFIGIAFAEAEPSKFPEAFDNTKLEAAIPERVLLSALIVLFVNV